jgi:hypothetical protein
MTHPEITKPGPDEEPAPTAEESVPTDGKDAEGEKMMEDLGRQRQAQDAKGAPAPTGKRSG